MRSPPEIVDRWGLPLRVGDRVECGGEGATVEYCGAVEGERGEWLGLRWEDPSRGKHDGRGYFAAGAPTGGSFVRPQRLDRRRDCAGAIRECYADGEDETVSALNRAGIDDLKRKTKAPFVEMVGFDKVHRRQECLDRLEEAYVSNRNVYVAGELATLCPALQVLDVSKNLFRDWTEIADLVKQLPLLHTLDLSKMKLCIPQDASGLSKHFDRLKKLSLSHCDLDWNKVLMVAAICCSLESLVLAYNKIAQISPFNNLLESLTVLVLDGNKLHSWNEVLKLGHLRKLNILSMNDCGIENIVIDDTYREEKSNLFESLETLFLKQNLINDWRSVSELHKLKSLQKLYILKNPLLSLDDYDTISQSIIARLPNLTELNGSEIKRELKRGAEYDYLKKFGLTWNKIQNSPEDVKLFCLENSNFLNLVQKYGLPEESLLNAKKESWAINSNLMEILLKVEHSDVVVKKKLPCTMTVQKLIALARRLFASKSSKSSIDPVVYTVRTNLENNSQVNLYLENQMKELNFYSIVDGDTITIKW